MICSPISVRQKRIRLPLKNVSDERKKVTINTNRKGRGVLYLIAKQTTTFREGVNYTDRVAQVVDVL